MLKTAKWAIANEGSALRHAHTEWKPLKVDYSAACWTCEGLMLVQCGADHSTAPLKHTNKTLNVCVCAGAAWLPPSSSFALFVSLCAQPTVILEEMETLRERNSVNPTLSNQQLPLFSIKDVQPLYSPDFSSLDEYFPSSPRAAWSDVFDEALDM